MAWAFSRRGMGVCVACVLWLTSAVARAEYTRDRAARAKIEEALERYLRTEFDSAESLLTGTIKACEDRCRPATLARAWMYVGLVRGSGKNEQEHALEAFGRALEADPDVKLDAELATDATASTWQLALEGRPERPGDDEPDPPVRSKPITKPDSHPVEPDICPPGFPACVSEHGPCQVNVECKGGLECRGAERGARGTCELPNKTSPALLRPKRHWLGLHAALDFVHLPSVADACARPYHCFEGGREIDTSEASGGIGGGFARGTTRMLASYEYRFSERWFAAGRAGVAFGGAPSGFLPAHAELRFGARFSAAWWFAASLHAGGGLAELDARLPVLVGDGNTARGVDSYGAFGRTFVSAGGGATLLVSKGLGIEAGLNALWLFPDASWALEPSLGVVVGF